MKYQYFIFLFILTITVSFFESDLSHRFYSSKTITKSTLKNEIISRMERVDELRAMKELANELGIKQVYLFGGSAAAWAHYVYWDLEREAEMGNYHESRFDYDYTSIFRANQDMDIVVDVDEENQDLVKKFEEELQKRFAHFQGDKSAWEVRPLRINYGNKEKILDNPDFLNQNSDSHSTGLISVTGNDEFAIRDFKDWNNPSNHFFDDVYNRELHYYRDQIEHKSTKRFKQGLNPEIFSAIRYLTKAFQYELKIDPESMKQIQDVLRKFDVKKDLIKNYSKIWIEKNAIKLYQNAIDLEFAYMTMNKLNFQKLLISINQNSKEQNSMAWWMNKMPLLSKELGNPREGKTAGELGISIVAHETNDFGAYESITKSHSGKANVFISRIKHIGENAIHGDGFYTRIGKRGARNTGLTIRFKVDPNAVEGVDFFRTHDYIIVKNKKMLEVIPESLDISPEDYFKKLVAGEFLFDHTNRGVKEKVKRKIGLKLNNFSYEQKNELAKIIKEYLNKYKQIVFYNIVISEWFSNSISGDFPEIVELLIKKGKIDEEIVINILSKENWAKNEKGADLILQLIKKGNVDREIAEHILSKKHWANNPRGAELLRTLIKKRRAANSISYYVFSEEHWANHEKGAELLKKLIKIDKDNYNIASRVLSHKFWANHEMGAELLEILIKKGTSDIEIAIRVLAEPYWINHEKGAELLEMLINRGKTDHLIAQYILSNRFWANHEKGGAFLEKLVKRGKADREIAKYVLSNDYWANHEKAIELLEQIIKRGKINLIIAVNVLPNDYWAQHEKGAKLLERIIWSGKEGEESIVDTSILSEKAWQENPYLKEKLKGKEVTFKNIKLYLKSEDTFKKKCLRMLSRLI